MSELITKLSCRAPDFAEHTAHSPSNKSTFRDPYKADLGRVIHSASFRRLQAKTQVMGTGEGDFHRTRLTHSIEVGQIARGILWRLLEKVDENLHKYLPSSELIEAISYCHDLGHPPFGHGGEVALQKLMWDRGGFEGNAQTLRIITKLEKIYEFDGIKPTRRLLLGILKYPVNYGRYDSRAHKIRPPKCYYDTEQDIVFKALDIFSAKDIELFTSLSAQGKPQFKSFDCTIMDLADDIAYGVHDLEDGIGRGILQRDVVAPVIFDLLNEAGIEKFGFLNKNQIIQHLFSVKANERKFAISELVNFFIQAISVRSRNRFESPFLDLQIQIPEYMRLLLDRLTADVIFKFVVKKPQLQTLERKGERIIADIFHTLQENPVAYIGKSTLSGQSRDLNCLFKGSETVPMNNLVMVRGISDFIASMTDTGAMHYHKRLFEPGYGNSVDEM